MNPTIGRSKGAVALAKSGCTQKEIAARVGVGQTIVAYWIAGARVPNGTSRKRLRAHFKIPPQAWDEPVLQPVKHINGNGTAPLSKAITDQSIRANAVRWHRAINQIIDELTHDGKATAREKLRSMQVASNVLDRLAEMTGEKLRVSEKKIVMMPAWYLIEQIIDEALRPWPEAARAVAHALLEIKKEEIQ